MSWPVEVVMFVLLGMGGLTTDPVDWGAEVEVEPSAGLICVDAGNDEIGVFVFGDEKPFGVSIRVWRFKTFYTCMLST
jgi:hypothetical protein